MSQPGTADRFGFAQHSIGGASDADQDDDVAIRRPRVAAVIVTYNSADVLGGCLRSLAAASTRPHLTDVIVVDNGSTDGSVDVAVGASDLPVRTIQLGRNTGYAAGINAGIASLNTRDIEAVLVLNPDCRVGDGALARLAAGLRAPGRGIVVPRLQQPDGRLNHSLRRMPTVRGALAEAIVGGNLAGRVRELGEVITDPAAYDEPGEVVWATGAAMLISMTALPEIGQWDESFFLYSEETEFALRARKRGWQLWYEPTAVVEHIGGESGTDPGLAALMIVNKVRLFRRLRGRWASLAYYAAIAAGQGVRALAGRRTARAAVMALLVPARRSRLPGPR